MQRYTCTVKLGDSLQHIVTNKGPVSVAEIAVLRRVHGDTAVSDFKYVDSYPIKVLEEVDGEQVERIVQFDPAEERASLRQRYDNAGIGGSEPIVDQCFGVLGPLPKTLGDIGVSTKSQAALLRAKAQAALEEAEKLENIDEAEDVDTLFSEDAED